MDPTAGTNRCVRNELGQVSSDWSWIARAAGEIVERGGRLGAEDEPDGGRDVGQRFRHLDRQERRAGPA